MQENDIKQRIIERLEHMNDKRSKEREIREKNHQEWKQRIKEINNTTYLHEKLERSTGRISKLYFTF